MIVKVIHGETVPPCMVKRYCFHPFLDGETVPHLIVKTSRLLCSSRSPAVDKGAEA